MSNALLAYNNRIDAATLTGGSWTAGLPLANLKNNIIGVLARTIDDALTSTKFTIDIGADKIWRTVGVFNHNLSLDGKVRFRAHNEEAVLQNAIWTENVNNWYVHNTMTVAVDAEVAPDGQATMDNLVEVAGTSLRECSFSFSFLPYSMNILSVHIRPGLRKHWVMYPSSNYNGTVIARFDLSGEGAVTSIGGSATAGVVKLENGDFRLWLACVALTANGSSGCFLAPTDESYSQTYASPGGVAGGVWGSNALPGSALSSYYPNTTASYGVTRPAGYFNSWQSYDYDSGWLQAWPDGVYDPENLSWEQTNYWSGQYSDEEREGLTTKVVHHMPGSGMYRYIQVDIDDTGNAAGYVQLGRVLVADAWQLTVNMSYGAAIAIEDPSEIDETMSGAEFATELPKYRVAQFSVENMSEVEAMGNVFEILRKSGITREVYFEYDPEDLANALRRSFLGRLRKLSAIEHNNVDAFDSTFEIKERL